MLGGIVLEDNKGGFSYKVKLFFKIIKNLFKIIFKQIGVVFKSANIQVALTYFLIFSTILTFYYSKIKIPKIKDSVRNATLEEFNLSSIPKGFVVAVKKDTDIIRSSTILKADILSYFELIELPSYMLTDQMVDNIEELNGKLLTTNLNPGEFVFYSDISDNARWLNDFDRLKEYPVKT